MPRGRRARIAAIAAALAMFALEGCQGKLPQQDSYAGQLYMKRCGNCHQPYNPHSMTPAMWQVQVPMMEQKMQQAGMHPLSDEDRKTIMDYLQRNSGSQ